MLWTARVHLPGRGRPQFSLVHPQRRAMRRLLCQVCARPADRTGDGVLWLPDDQRDAWPTWPEGLTTVHPPVCAPCAPLAARACPNLRRTGAVAVRVARPVLDGVWGRTYRLDHGALVPDEKTAVLYEQRDRLPWVHAAQGVTTLHGCTSADLTRLHTGAPA